MWKNVQDLTESRVDTGSQTIEIKVWEGSTTLDIDASNLKVRNPAQAIGEGTKLSFRKDSSGTYKATFNFIEPGKTYYLEGTYTILKTGEIIPVEKTINTAGSSTGAEATVFDPTFIVYAVIGFIILVGFGIFLISRGKK